MGELRQLRRTKERRALHPGNMAESHIPLISIGFLWEILSMKSMLRVKKQTKQMIFPLSFLAIMSRRKRRRLQEEGKGEWRRPW